MTHLTRCYCYTVYTHRSIEHHDLPQHLSDIGQRVRRQTETTRVHELSDELLTVLLHGLTNQLLPHFKVLLVLQRQRTDIIIMFLPQRQRTDIIIVFLLQTEDRHYHVPAADRGKVLRRVFIQFSVNFSLYSDLAVSVVLNFLFPLTHVVGDSGVDEVSDKLHDAAVGVPVVQ